MKLPGLLVTILTVLLLAGPVSASIRTTRHNLSASGPGDLRSLETSRICVFCHTSHSGNRQGPLWNRESGPVVYSLYNSSTLHSAPDQPDGASKLCLSCHDGTIALGFVLVSDAPDGEYTILNTDQGRLPVTRRSNLDVDLTDDHPVSFNPAGAVSASPELHHPPVGGPVRYDAAGRLQCTTCHDPHEDLYGRFLRMDNRQAALCKTCHRPNGYTGLATHDLSAAVPTGGVDPWPHTTYTTVAENSCLNCHRTHDAGGGERLLSAAVEEDVCLICHDGSLGPDIRTEINRPSAHPVQLYSGLHDPVEQMPTAPVHVECTDCHNPHAANATTALAPAVGGRLTNVTGMSISGAIVDPALYEYEVCLKCHGDDRYLVPATTRVDDTSNLRIAYTPANASFHPVAAVGRSLRVPSLRPGYTVTSRIYCTDCHSSSASTRAGGTGPVGPHGSAYPFLLERNYDTLDMTPYSESAYALCFKCHDPWLVLTSGARGFQFHRIHIERENTPCSVCHDPHGSPLNTGLINFDTTAVFPDSNGELRFEINGGTGSCTLTCHNEEHSPATYMRR